MRSCGWIWPLLYGPFLPAWHGQHMHTNTPLPPRAILTKCSSKTFPLPHFLPIALWPHLVSSATNGMILNSSRLWQGTYDSRHPPPNTHELGKIWHNNLINGLALLLLTRHSQIYNPQWITRTISCCSITSWSAVNRELFNLSWQKAAFSGNGFQLKFNSFAN